jgi:hypothetical protein
MNFMNDIDSWLGMQNPANGAQGYLNQIPGMMQGYYNPYIQAGQQALPQLQQQFGDEQDRQRVSTIPWL